MSSIPQNHFDENDLIDCVQRFFPKHHVGKLLAKCYGMKKRCFTSCLLRYKLSNILSEEVCICNNEPAFLRTVFQKQFLSFP